jgi:Pyruvate/2-oxoacid:ferredoxin oxidoreductase gamma subunit
MKETIIIAGFGGQGVLTMGKILAYSGIMQDMEVLGCLHTVLRCVVVPLT